MISFKCHNILSTKSTRFFGIRWWRTQPKFFSSFFLLPLHFHFIIFIFSSALSADLCDSPDFFLKLNTKLCGRFLKNANTKKIHFCVCHFSCSATLNKKAFLWLTWNCAIILLRFFSHVEIWFNYYYLFITFLLGQKKTEKRNKTKQNKKKSVLIDGVCVCQYIVALLDLLFTCCMMMCLHPQQQQTSTDVMVDVRQTKRKQNKTIIMLNSALILNMPLTHTKASLSTATVVISMCQSQVSFSCRLGKLVCRILPINWCQFKTQKKKKKCHLFVYKSSPKLSRIFDETLKRKREFLVQIQLNLMKECGRNPVCNKTKNLTTGRLRGARTAPQKEKCVCVDVVISCNGL